MCVQMTIKEFNAGPVGASQVFDALGIRMGCHSRTIFQRRAARTANQAKRVTSPGYISARIKKKAHKTKSNNKLVEDEGPSYAAGSF